MPEQVQDELGPGSPVAPPGMLDALIPVVTVIVLIALSVSLFGLDSIGGPLQVAIFTSAAIAALIAHKNGWSSTDVNNAVTGGISTIEYLPYCFFNLINSNLSMVYGFVGFKMDRIAPGEMSPEDGILAPLPTSTAT